MARLTHTGAQLDAAIRKVRSDFADVSSVDAAANDVRAGKKIINAQKKEVIGSMPESIITPIATISGDTIGDTVTDYPIQIAPGGTIDKAGYVEIVPEGEVITKYIKTETKICTPSDTIQEIVPSSGKLLSKVTVREAGEVRPSLSPPSISITGHIITITNNALNGNFVTGYDIYCTFNGVDTKIVQNTTSTNLNLESAMTSAGFTANGSYTITVKAKGTNFNDSAASNNQQYVIALGFNVKINISGVEDVFYYKVNNDTTYIAIDYLSSGLVIANVTRIAFYYTSVYSDQPSNHSVSGNYSIVSDYHVLNGPITIDFYSSIKCFVENTRITMENGSFKYVQDVELGDEVITFNFDEGNIDKARVMWVAKESIAPCYWKMVLEDGTILKTVGANGKSHRIFNDTKKAFMYPQDFDKGDAVLTNHGSYKMVSLEKIYSKVKYYNLESNYHDNIYAEGVLCGSRFSMPYTIDDNYKFIKEKRNFYKREDFMEIPDDLFYGLRINEQPLIENQTNNVMYFNTVKEHLIHNYIEHSKNYHGSRDYKRWLFKQGGTK